MNKCPFEIRYDAVPGVRNDQLATLNQHGDRRRRPSGLWSICVSGDRCGDAVGFSLSTRRQCNGRRQAERDRQKIAAIPASATGPELRLHRRSSNANSLCGRNSAHRKSARPFKGIFCDDNWHARPLKALICNYVNRVESSCVRRRAERKDGANCLSYSHDTSCRPYVKAGL